MAGGSQVPLWITITLGVLAVVGTVGGAWGGQLIAGRNESRRWRRERDREAHAFWRDRRVAAYAAVLAHLEAVLDSSSFYLMFMRGPEGSEFSYPEAKEHLDAAAHEIDTVRLIGTEAAIQLSMKAKSRISTLAWAISGSHPSLGQGTDREDQLNQWYDEAREVVDELQSQFRKDLGVAMPVE
ncbi:MAG: hypothetical protein ACRDQ0_13560 [Pseudonocardia sp.]